MKDNPEGLYEAQLKLKSLAERPARLNYKKRQLKELSHTMREAVVHAYLKEHMFQKDVARLFRVTPALVSKLVCEAQQQPSKQQ